MLYSTSVGLDVHARSIKAAAFVPETAEIIEKSFFYEPSGLANWIKTLPQPVQCVYESGPTGFDLLRKLEADGIVCHIGAVTKMLRPSGDRIKNDRRDALFLARMLAVGNIVSIYVPTFEEEAARDLCRAREDVRHDLTRAKQLLSKFLLRKGVVYDEGRCAWTKTHRRWLEGLRMPSGDEQAVLDEYLFAIADIERRCERIDARIRQRAEDPRWSDIVSRLSCLRGINTLTALAIAVEIGDFSRFRNAGAFASYLGLVPSLNESGESSSRGRITKTGNTHVRKLIVEAAWHHLRRYRPTTGRSRDNAIDSATPSVAQIAHGANMRLHKRFFHLKDRKLPSCKANTAVARELAGWVWSLALMK
jgi:transposase